MKPQNDSEFDQYATAYEEALQKGVSLSGESKDYFAQKRVDWLKRRLLETGRQTTAIMDFGCGTGGAIPFLAATFQPALLVGLDVSTASISLAQQEFGSDTIRFSTPEEYSPAGDFDLVFCNGVFHHIPPLERPGCLKFIANSLKPGGVFAMWENNPWNLGTRMVMARIPFDRDAIVLSYLEARALMREAGLTPEHSDFQFFFPRFLSWLRPLEASLRGIPLGAQYMVFGRKPE